MCLEQVSINTKSIVLNIYSTKLKPISMKPMKIKVLYPILAIAMGCSSCRFAETLEGSKFKFLIPNKIEKLITKQKTVFIKCGKGTINEYKEKGWKVINKTTSEVPCSWKTEKSRRGCNPKKDKGCLINIPDRMGTESIYLLEKQFPLTSEDNGKQTTK